MNYEPIITNNAWNKMVEKGIIMDELIAAYNSSMIENTGTRIPGSTVGIYRMNGYEVCAMCVKDHNGQWIIISCWKRPHGN